MNRKEHLIFSIALIMGAYLAFNTFEWIDFIKYLPILFITSALPDFIEPAVNPHHRAFFHSKRTFKFLGTFGLGISFFAGIFNPNYYYVFFGILGYLSHLIADSLTYRGLPN